MSTVLLMGGGIAMVAGGCASNAKAAAPTNLRAGIPPAATLVTSGTAPSFSSTEPGRIYVYDATDNVRLGIYSMRQGQQFVLDPKSGRATVEGNEVVIDDVKNGHVYQIYFESDTARLTNAPTNGSASNDGNSNSGNGGRVEVYTPDNDATRKANSR